MDWPYASVAGPENACTILKKFQLRLKIGENTKEIPIAFLKIGERISSSFPFLFSSSNPVGQIKQRCLSRRSVSKRHFWFLFF